MRNRACWMALMVLLPVSAAHGRLSTRQESWGAGGTAVTRYTLTNSHGASVSFMPLGAAILSLKVPDRNGHLADVVLGYDQPSDYNNNNSPEFGLTIGRYANRIIGAR
ncbi:MAG TPA: hypothetical protein VLL04_12850, partial [Rhizomicrobium sp.]|nr:hypothetical protein [Rhizomicrobium sp.]